MSTVQDGTARSPRATKKGWAAVLAVALGIFCLMTSELLPVGLLTPVGEALDVSEGVAGLMVTVPGLVAAISAPLITVAAGRIDRRVVLCVLVALVGAANLVSAIAANFTTVLIARLLIGVAVGGFWAIAGGLALRLVPQEKVGKATAVIFGGVSTASVLGVPIGTLIGDLSGWRPAFAAVGALGLLSLVALVVLLPKLPATTTVRFPELPRLLGANGGVRTGVLITFLLITGHFTAYTFVRPVLQDISGIDGSWIGTLLLIYGAAGIVGNFLAGSKASRDARRTVMAITAALTVAVVLLALVQGSTAAGVILLVVWGLAYGGVSVTLQTWILQAAPKAPEAATSLFVAMFNLSIALGALIGGVAVDSLSTAASLWIAAGLVVLTLLSATAAKRPNAPSRRAASGAPAKDAPDLVPATDR